MDLFNNNHDLWSFNAKVKHFVFIENGVDIGWYTILRFGDEVRGGRGEAPCKIVFAAHILII